MLDEHHRLHRAGQRAFHSLAPLASLLPEPQNPHRSRDPLPHAHHHVLFALPHRQRADLLREAHRAQRARLARLARRAEPQHVQPREAPYREEAAGGGRQLHGRGERHEARPRALHLQPGGRHEPHAVAPLRHVQRPERKKLPLRTQRAVPQNESLRARTVSHRQMKRSRPLVAFQQQRQFPASFQLRFHGFSSFSSFHGFSNLIHAVLLPIGFPSFPSFPGFPGFNSDLLALDATAHFDQRGGLQ